MKRNIDWEDLRLFLAVAKAGGLAGAADKTGVSPQRSAAGLPLWRKASTFAWWSARREVTS